MRQSDGGVHTGLQDLVTEATSIGEESMQLMKFHGSYQQDDRDKRTGGKGKFYQFMMRTRQPAGHVTNRLYLVMDDLADLVRPCTPLLPPALTLCRRIALVSYVHGAAAQFSRASAALSLLYTCVDPVQSHVTNCLDPVMDNLANAYPPPF